MDDLKNLEDTELIRQTLKGNKRAYENIVLRYQKLVFNVVFQILKQPESAADITQEAFLKAYQALPTFKIGCALRPWLLRIATNSALNQIRSSRPYQSLEQLLEDTPNMEPASREDVESEVATNLDEEKLLAVLGTLPPQHRHLFLLRYQHDLSYEEIAQVMDQPVTTIKSMLFRVRTKVRALVNKDAVEVSNLRSEP